MNKRLKPRLNIGPAFIALLTIAISPLAVSPAAQADDFKRDGFRGQTYCYPAKHAAKTIKEIAKVKPEQRDVVDIKMAPRFLIYDDGALPQRYYVKDKTGETDFTITADGKVPDFLEKVLIASKTANLCITDDARAGLPADDESLYFEMGLTPFFNQTTGRHTLEELVEATKDGKAHYKKMVPSAVRAFMPNTNYFHVKYTAENTSPQIFAETENGPTALEGEFYNEGYVIALRALEAVDATALLIEGGHYKLAPVPSIKTMKRYGVGRPRGPQKDAAQAN